MTKINNPYRQIVSGQRAAAPAGDRVAIEAKTKLASKQEEKQFDEQGDFNPKAYGGHDAIRGALSSQTNRMFNREGQINANDKKDALQQIAHLLQNVTRDVKTARASRNDGLAPERRREVLAAAMRDPEGFAILGQELLLPIKDIVDYEGWARKIYRVRPLAQGELFRMAKDVRAAAFVIGQDGQGIESVLHGKYIQPSEFKITAFPSVDLEDIMQMNYDVLDRAQDTARQEIEVQEDKRALGLLDAAARAVNTVTTFASLGVSAFEDVRYQVERHRLQVEKFMINRAELSDVVKTMSTAVDPVTERELILSGYIGSFLNAKILTSAGIGVEEVIPAGTFYAVTGPEYLGEMGIRVELFSEPFNKFSHRETKKGWAFCEMLGFGIPNARAVAVGEK